MLKWGYNGCTNTYPSFSNRRKTHRTLPKFGKNFIETLEQQYSHGGSLNEMSNQQRKLKNERKTLSLRVYGERVCDDNHHVLVFHVCYILGDHQDFIA